MSSTDIRISDQFDVLKTQFGRACFANRDIPKGVDILVTNEVPFGFSILHEFRKEVCSFCFVYEFGKYCKVKIPQVEKYEGKKWLGCGLWFCSEQCMKLWREKIDLNNKLSLIFEDLLNSFQKKLLKNDYNEDEFNDIEITKDFIDKYWSKVNDWELKVDKMKESKKMNQLPSINEDDFNTVRFVTIVLFNLYKNHPSSEFFTNLQSNEFEKIKKFPVLLKSLESIYKFLKILLPSYLNLNTELFRLIIGREFGNSFGIWQINEDSLHENSENKEFLGYMLHPEASFFNHSCDPNVKKYRIDNRMHFQTMNDIKKDDQLCIDYYHVLNDPYLERQKIMMDNWFFSCLCERCKLESNV